VPKEISQQGQKIAKIIPCFTQDYFGKSPKAPLYRITNPKKIKNNSLETRKKSIIDIYV